VGAVEPDALRLSKYEAEELTTALVEADAKLVGAAGEAGVTGAEIGLAPALLREAAYEDMPDPVGAVAEDLGRASK
jgi:hypothetical protein